MARRIISSHDEDGLPEPGTRRTGSGPRAVVSHAGTAGSTGTAGTETSRRHGRTARSAASGGKPSGETSVRKGFVDMRRMPSEDVVAKTLNETAGVLGVPTRPKIVDFNARLKERRRLSLKVIAIRTAAALAALAAVSALIWLLFFSSVFRLETSRISVSGGNDWVSSSDILAIAGKQSGRSLLLVSTNDVASQLKNIPGVTEATVKKQFPNSLSVTVKAQQPAAMLKGPGNTMVAVDSQGRVLNQVGDASTDGIPTIDVANVERSLGSKAVKEALKVLGSLPDSLRSTITKVTADTQDSITTELNGGEHVVIWGDSSDLTLKQAIVDKILSDPNVIGDKKQVDVSAPSRPIIK